MVARFPQRYLGIYRRAGARSRRRKNAAHFFGFPKEILYDRPLGDVILLRQNHRRQQAAALRCIPNQQPNRNLTDRKRSLPLPLGEVAEQSEDGEGNTMSIVPVVGATIGRPLSTALSPCGDVILCSKITGRMISAPTTSTVPLVGAAICRPRGVSRIAQRAIIYGAAVNGWLRAIRESPLRYPPYLS